MSCQWTAVADKEAGKGPGRFPRDEGVEVERRKLQRKGPRGGTGKQKPPCG